jgi:hypothetical protein
VRSRARNRRSADLSAPPPALVLDADVLCSHGASLPVDVLSVPLIVAAMFCIAYISRQIYFRLRLTIVFWQNIRDK